MARRDVNGKSARCGRARAAAAPAPCSLRARRPRPHRALIARARRSQARRRRPRPLLHRSFFPFGQETARCEPARAPRPSTRALFERPQPPRSPCAWAPRARRARQAREGRARPPHDGAFPVGDRCVENDWCAAKPPARAPCHARTRRARAVPGPHARWACACAQI